MSQRAKNRERTRARLLEVTRARLASGEPFVMGDVTDEAKVSLRTVHRYFPDGRTQLILDALGITEGMALIPSKVAAEHLAVDHELLGAAFVRVSGGRPDRFEHAAAVLADGLR